MPHDSSASAYRLAPSVVVRLVGAWLVLGVLLGLGLLVANLLTGLSTGVLLGFALGWATAALGLMWWLRFRAAVVTLGDDGYEVGLVRSPGVRAARWCEVGEVTVATARGVDMLVLELGQRDDESVSRSTVIPVQLLAGSPDALVADVQRRAQRGHGLTRISSGSPGSSEQAGGGCGRLGGCDHCPVA